MRLDRWPLPLRAPDGDPGAAGNPGGGDAGLFDWGKSGLDADHQTWIGTKGYKTPADVVKAARSLEGRLPLDHVPLPPRDKDGNRDYSKFDYGALGRPEAPDKYAFKDAEGVTVSPEMDKWFRDAAHKHGLGQHQAQALRTAWNEYATKVNGETEAGRKTELERRAGEATAALQKDWGASFEGNKGIVGAWIDKHVPELAKDGFADQIMTYAPLAKLLHQAAVAMGETGGPLDGSKGGAGGDAGVQGEIDAIIKDLKGPYHNADHPEHKATVDKVAGLFTRKHAGKA